MNKEVQNLQTQIKAINYRLSQLEQDMGSIADSLRAIDAMAILSVNSLVENNLIKQPTVDMLMDTDNAQITKETIKTLTIIAKTLEREEHGKTSK